MPRAGASWARPELLLVVVLSPPLLVVRGNVAKFGQHEDLRAFLFATRERVIVEASPRDRVWGIGMGLLEETIPDPNYMRYVNTNLAEYHVPVNKDVPPIEIILVPEEDRWVSPVGAKGAGEIGITGCAAAIGNAVFHATGKRIRDLPITLDKIM